MLACLSGLSSHSNVFECNRKVRKHFEVPSHFKGGWKCFTVLLTLYHGVERVFLGPFKINLFEQRIVICVCDALKCSQSSYFVCRKIYTGSSYEKAVMSESFRG